MYKQLVQESVELNQVYRLRSSLHGLLHVVSDLSTAQQLIFPENRVIVTEPLAGRTSQTRIHLCHFETPENSMYGRYISRRVGGLVLDRVHPDGTYWCTKVLKPDEIVEENRLLYGFIQALRCR